MNGEGTLLLTLRDVYDERLKGRVDVRLDHATMPSASRMVKDKPASVRLRIINLKDGPYKISIFPTLYRPIRQYVMITEGQTTKRTNVFPVDPEKVIGIDAPSFDNLHVDFKKVLQDSEIESMPGRKGVDLYSALDDFRKAGLLNIYCKMVRTVFPGGRNTFSYVKSLTRIRGDRFFAKVAPDLRDEVKNVVPHNIFKEVLNLDHTPPPRYSKAGSFKTGDKYGNLQLTFFCKEDTLDFIIDADIDDASGILHSFQVIEHYLKGTGTNPYDIHEILMHHQQLNPNYRLLV